MTSQPEYELTDLLEAWSGGDEEALSRLVPLVVEDLRQTARAHLRGEREGHTLQTTALVNEVYLRLVGKQNVRFQGRGQFFVFAGNLMRRVLIDHARRRNARKRGGGASHQSLEETWESRLPPASIDLERAAAVSEALGRLEELDEQQCRVVELRFLVGLELEEIAQALEISRTTVRRKLVAARYWLARELDISLQTPSREAEA